MHKKKCVSIICGIYGCAFTRFTVELFDDEGNLLRRTFAYPDNPIRFYVIEDKKYKVKATVYDVTCCISPHSISKWLDPSLHYKNIQYFMFGNNNRRCCKKLWKFRLTDANYQNLPISEGILYVDPSFGSHF